MKKCAPPVSGKSWSATSSSPSGASCTSSIRQTRPWTSLTSEDHAPQNAPTLSPQLQPPPTTQPRWGSEDPPRTASPSSSLYATSRSNGHQELLAVRGKDRLHARRRNLHQPGQGPPLALPWISGHCCPPLVENLQIANKNHMLCMDRFYNTTRLGGP